MLIGEKKLSVSDINKVLFEGEKIVISAQALKRVEDNFLFLRKFSEGKLIYGINTGFGPMAQYRIEENEQIQLQYNLIRSHSSGVGNPLTPLYVKSLMLARLNTLLQGYSGVHVSIILLLRDFINHDISPLVFEHGGVGASGDLVQLAHLALTLIGEGEVYYQDELQPTGEVLEKVGLKPIDIHCREGLGIMNGTSVMTGIGLVNLYNAKKLLYWATSMSSMINELVGSYDDHFSVQLNQVKHHVGQNKIAGFMREFLTDSKLVKKREQHLYDKRVSETVIKEKVQEYYSLRCVPQILGPVYDTLKYAEDILEGEVNSVNDNPIINSEEENVFHGGNFHGDYVSLEMDKIKIVITKLSMLLERQLNFLLNHKLNDILPPFVNLGKLGFNFGMQGVQFTATSTVAENQTLSNPMYVHSIPNNNDNQDIVSMGTNAAVLTKKVIENTFEVLAIELMTVLQAIDYLKVEGKLSEAGQKIYKETRQIVPTFVEDSIKYKDVQNLKNYLFNTLIDTI